MHLIYTKQRAHKPSAFRDLFNYTNIFHEHNLKVHCNISAILLFISKLFTYRVPQIHV